MGRRLHHDAQIAATRDLCLSSIEKTKHDPPKQQKFRTNQFVRSAVPKNTNSPSIGIQAAYDIIATNGHALARAQQTLALSTNSPDAISAPRITHAFRLTLQ
jgi:hypothetical protein